MMGIRMKRLALLASITATLNGTAGLPVVHSLIHAGSSASLVNGSHPATPTSRPDRTPAARERPVEPKLAMMAAQVLWTKVHEDLARGLAAGVKTGDLSEAQVLRLRSEVKELGDTVAGGDGNALALTNWTSLEPWAARGIRIRTMSRAITEFDATTDYGRVTNFRRLIALMGVDKVPAPGVDTPEFVARDMDLAKHNMPRTLLGVPLLGSPSSDSQNLTTTIDADNQRLSPSFDEILCELGPPSTFDEVFAEVRKIPRFKDEFETTNQFDDRQASAMATCARHYLIEAPVDHKYVRYDADAQVLSVVTYALTNTRASDGELNSLFGHGSELRASGQVLGYSTISSNIAWAFPRDQRDVDTYDGSNAFGATLKITKQQGIARGVFEREGTLKENVWTEKAESNAHGTPTVDPVAFEVRTDPSTAKSLKNGGLRAALLVAPRAPYYVTGVDRFSPTIRAPFDRTTDVRYLIGDLQCVALFDPSGKLIAIRATR